MVTNFAEILLKYEMKLSEKISHVASQHGNNKNLNKIVIR